ILKDAKTAGYLKEQPEPLKIKVVAKEKEILTGSEQKKLCEELQNSLNPKDLAIILGAATGLRLGEVLGLNLGDVDLEAGVLRVCRSRQRVTVKKGSKTSVQLASLKSRKSRRDIPINAPLMRIFEKYMAALTGRSANAPLIWGHNKKALDSRTIQNHFSLLKKTHHLSSGVTF
ncbi:MAG: tyrosine-type recombinase/integrase, partial [Eubacterium sp.]